MQIPRHRTHANRTDESHTLGALGHGWRRAAALAGASLAILAVPASLAWGSGSDRSGHVAVLGDNAPLKGAIHNPANSSFLRTTGIFANFSSWTARIQNVGAGGAATFGCRADAGGSACLNAENSNGGLAFTFASTGMVGGKILLTDSKAAPFTTNATGEATGLNANYLQGKKASEFLPAGGTAVNANALGGKAASEYATGQLLFADISSGKLEGHRGATSVSSSGTEYTITFGSTDVSNCSFTVSPVGDALTGGQLGVAPKAGATSSVIVSGPTGFSGSFDLQVIC